MIPGENEPSGREKGAQDGESDQLDVEPADQKAAQAETAPVTGASGDVNRSAESG
jgi:hypothetical protein